MPIRSFIGLTATAIVAGMLVAPLTFAGQPQPANPPPSNSPPSNSSPAEPTQLPSAAAMVAPQISKLEDDIAQLVQKQGDTAAAALPWLNLQIDSRIIARWMLSQSAQSRDLTVTQIAGYLHGMSMIALVPVVDDFSSKQNAAPNAVQQTGIDKLHQLTFGLKDAKDVAAFDNTSATTAENILIAITPMEGGQKLPALVDMRPSVDATSQPMEQTAAASVATQGGERSLDDLAGLARQASVAPSLRRELVATAALAQQAQADPAKSDEAKSLRKVLEASIDLSAGLQANTAVTPEERGQIETQLGDSLALYGDPRTRSAGESRLASLDQYRQLLGRVTDMRVPPELKEALSPPLAWAHEHPDQGDKVLSAIEKFLSLYTRQQAVADPPVELGALRPGDLIRRSYDDLKKQFIKERGDFLGDAANLGGGATPGGDNTLMSTSVGPDALSDGASEMAKTAKLMDVLVAMPKTFETLIAFKPRPSGGIERRVNSLLYTINSTPSTTTKSPARDEAIKQLFNLHQLAMLANDLTRKSALTIPPAVAQTYAGDQISAVQLKWKAMITESASQFSTNQPIDSAKLNRLKSLSALLDSLPGAIEMDAAFAKPEGLAKWADWTVTIDQVHALLAPYQQAMSQAFTSFVSDTAVASGDGSSDFGKIRQRYQPMLRLLIRTAGYADACAALPEGVMGSLSRLATPCSKSPFEQQRFASFVAALSASTGGDAGATQTAASTISDHLHP